MSASLSENPFFHQHWAHHVPAPARSRLCRPFRHPAWARLESGEPPQLPARELQVRWLAPTALEACHAPAQSAPLKMMRFAATASSVLLAPHYLPSCSGQSGWPDSSAVPLIYLLRLPVQKPAFAMWPF